MSDRALLTLSESALAIVHDRREEDLRRYIMDSEAIPARVSSPGPYGFRSIVPPPVVARPPAPEHVEAREALAATHRALMQAESLIHLALREASGRPRETGQLDPVALVAVLLTAADRLRELAPHADALARIAAEVAAA